MEHFIFHSLCTHLFVTLEHRTLERVRTAVARNIAEYLKVAAIVRHIEYPIDGVLHQFEGVRVFRPLLQFFLCG